MTTTTQVQLRRGTASQIATFTGAAGELAVDTTNNRVVVQDGVTPGGWSAAKLYDLPGGMRNRFRNATMDVWQRGVSAIAVSTAGAYTADGWIVVPTGASVSAAAAAGRQLTVRSLQVTGAASVTDVVVKQRIESYVAASLTSRPVTVQAQVFNNTGGTITPTLTVKHANAQDNWTAATTDINAVALQPCANAVWTQVAYTFTDAGLAANGLEISFDFGNNFSTNGKSIQITECDIRHTAGVPVGLNASPPPVELRPISVEVEFCQRYFASAFDNFVTPADGVANQRWLGFCNSSTVVAASYIPLPQSMRAQPSVTFYRASTGATNGQWSYNFGTIVDASATTLTTGTNGGTRQISVNLTGSGLTLAAVGVVVGMWTASAEL